MFLIMSMYVCIPSYQIDIRITLLSSTVESPIKEIDQLSTTQDGREDETPGCAGIQLLSA